MSRTYRTKRPQFKLGRHLAFKWCKNGKVRDGTPTHYASGCERHGDCPYCYNNRMFSTERRKPIE